MQQGVYSSLYQGLRQILPQLPHASAGTVFHAQSRAPGDIAVLCHVAQIDGNMRLIELVDGSTAASSAQPAPWLQMRMDVQGQVAEVLEMEDVHGYEVVYMGGQSISPRREAINAFALSWLQGMAAFKLAFAPVNTHAIA